MSISAARSNASVGVSSSITFLNFTGDITITWDEENRERILAIVRKKMAEGYSFFTSKGADVARVVRRTRVTDKNIDSLGRLVISDREFDILVGDIDDQDVAELINSQHAAMAQRIPLAGRKKETVLAERLSTAEDVVESRSVAIRPIVAG